MIFRKKHLTSIDAGHYKNTADQQTEVMPVPAVVKISMSENIGAPCKPLVKKGDYVKKGQLIGYGRLPECSDSFFRLRYGAGHRDDAKRNGRE